MAMVFQGSVTINSPRQHVYEFLTDPNKVSACAAEVQKLDVTGDNTFKVVAKAGVGFVKATFSLDVTWLERDPPTRARARAKGNAPGSAVDLTAEMDLSDADGGATKLDWKAEVTVAGTIASVGSRLLQGAANKITGDVFNCVKRTLEAEAPATAS
jgi:carbon monoxide dehydrogenase subunit G